MMFMVYLMLGTALGLLQTLRHLNDLNAEIGLLTFNLASPFKGEGVRKQEINKAKIFTLHSSLESFHIEATPSQLDNFIITSLHHYFGLIRLV